MKIPQKYGSWKVLIFPSRHFNLVFTVNPVRGLPDMMSASEEKEVHIKADVLKVFV